jgi:site-specific recombinase XerD
MISGPEWPGGDDTVTMLEQAIQAFLIDQQAGLNSDKTVKWYTSLLTAFDEYMHEKTLDAITANDLRMYVLHLRGRDLRDSSIIGHVTALRAFWVWAAREYEIPNPSRNIKKPRKAIPQPRAITPDDFGRLWNATYTGDKIAGVRDRCMLALLGDTGMRLGGLLSLQMLNILLEDDCLIVTEKGNRPRKVFYTRFTALQLIEWLKVRMEFKPTHSYLLTSMNHTEPLTASGVAQALKRLAKRGGVQGKYNPHSFRHGLAREWLKNGGDAIRLSQQMGSKVDTIAEYYALFFTDERAAAHEAFSPLNSYFAKETQK